MALIAAIFGSLAGVIAGIMGTLFFGASLIVGFAIYMTVALGMILAFSLSMLLRSNRQTLASATAYEDEMDANWAQFNQEQGRAMNDEERQFQADMETPLSEGDSQRRGERRNASDRRRDADRRDSA